MKVRTRKGGVLWQSGGKGIFDPGGGASGFGVGSTVPLAAKWALVSTGARK